MHPDAMPEKVLAPGTQRARARVALRCSLCGASFEVEPHRRHTAKYCSRACQHASRRAPALPCPTCQKPVRRPPSDPDRQYCSVQCRDAGRRVSVPCQACGKPMSLKLSESRARLFCSRKCMQTAWSCSYCAKLRPANRRGQEFCSERCALGARLETEGDEDGARRAVCGRCTRVLPATEFTVERANRNGLSNRCKQCTRDYYAQRKHRYRERRYVYKAAAGGKLLPFTEDDRAARFSMWGGRCWRCGVAGATEEDHVKPISQAGWHCLANLRPICHSCNASKRGSWPLTPNYLRANFGTVTAAMGSRVEERPTRQPRVDFHCPVCGQTRNMTASAAKGRKACSKECAYRGRTLPLVTLHCAACNRPFEVHHSVARTRRYCSHPCATRIRRRTTASTGSVPLFEL